MLLSQCLSITLTRAEPLICSKYSVGQLGQQKPKRTTEDVKEDATHKTQGPPEGINNTCKRCKRFFFLLGIFCRNLVLSRKSKHYKNMLEA